MTFSFGGFRSLQTSRDFLLTIVLAILAVVWFLILSHCIVGASNKVLTERQDVIFESDASGFVRTLVGKQWLPISHTFTIAHPLVIYLWRPVALVQTFLFEIKWPRKDAEIIAVRFLIAMIAGIGAGCLALFAIYNGVKTAHLIPLFLLYLLFTANTITALPDHFGLSNGLLSLNLLALSFTGGSRIRLILLAIIAVLVVGTTVTNFLFPAACLLFSLHASRSLVRFLPPRSSVILMILIMVLGLLAASFIIRDKIDVYISRFVMNRLIEDPLQACNYALLSMVYPAIGPVPYIVIEKSLNLNMISYEPFAIAQYDFIHGLAALSWAVLLLVSIYKSLKDDQSRAYACLLLAWLGFNVIFHNFWGDEFFLFSPHWSWTLMALVLLGARHLSWKFIVTIVVPIMIGQLYTLTQIRDALKSITF